MKSAILNKPILGLADLETLDVSHCSIMNVSKDYLDYFPRLKTLKLTGNDLEDPMIIKPPKLSYLKHVDVSYNKFIYLQKLFGFLPRLKKLQLNNNALKTLSFLSPNLNTLEILDLSNNQLNSIDKYTCDMIDDIFKYDTLLVFHGNPFQCTCNNVEFIKWIQQTQVNIAHRNSLECHVSDTGVAKIIEIDVNKMKEQCDATIIISSTVSGFALCVVTCLIMLYRCRWAIRWKYYKHKHKLKSQRQGLANQNDDNQQLPYTSFVILPEDEAENESIRWVKNELLMKLENEWGLTLFINGRDDIPGMSKIENLVDGLMSSHSALWIICPAFFKDKMCAEAVHFARHHFGQENNLLIILNDRYDEYPDPKQVHSLFDKRIGLRTANFNVADDVARSCFWFKVKEFVSKYTLFET